MLVAAVRHGLPEVTFSSIGPGFPMDRVVAIAIGTVSSALFAAPELRQVAFVYPDALSYAIHDDVLRTLGE